MASMGVGCEYCCKEERGGAEQYVEGRTVSK